MQKLKEHELARRVRLLRLTKGVQGQTRIGAVSGRLAAYNQPVDHVGEY